MGDAAGRAGTLHTVRSKWLWALVLAATLLGTNLVAAAAHAKTVVTVLYFDNRSTDPRFADLGKGLADMMITDLAKVPTLQVVERAKLEALLSELKLQRSAYFDPATVQKLGRGLGAEYALAGSLATLQPQVRIDTRLVRIATGEVVKTAHVVGDETHFFELQSQLVQNLIDGLQAALESKQGAELRAQPVQVSRVERLEHAAAYGAGLELADRGDVQGASAAMQKVVELAPQFQLAKDRYLELMRRIYQLKAEREREMTEAQRQLVEHIERHLQGSPPQAEGADVERFFESLQAAAPWFGYRVLRGQELVVRVSQRVVAGRRNDAAALWKTYVANQCLLANELVGFARTAAALQAAAPRERVNEVRQITGNIAAFLFRGKLDSADFAAARALGIAEPGEARFSHPSGVELQLARDMLYWAPGEGLGHMSANDKYLGARPACFDLSAGELEMGLGLADRAALDNPASLEAVLLAVDYCLLLHREADAVARLQALLARNPKMATEDLERVEKRVRDLLENRAHVERRCGDEPNPGRRPSPGVIYVVPGRTTTIQVR